MRQSLLSLIAALTLLAFAGCAAKTAGRTAATAGADVSPPTTTPEEPHAPDDPAFFTLDQILPVPELPKATPRATTRPAPLDALVAFAKGRDAMARGDRVAAITSLEKAAALDPNSPEIYEELGRAYGAQDKALPTYEKSLALEPDNLDLQERVGRQYLIKNKVDDALLHFRLALQTTEYQEDNESAAVLDFFLATALRRKNFDRAALERYACECYRVVREAAQRVNGQARRILAG
jgi:tetratricopeptide (TPR) repeat protein